jgi:hypothetical protein
MDVGGSDWQGRPGAEALPRVLRGGTRGMVGMVTIVDMAKYGWKDHKKGTIPDGWAYHIIFIVYILHIYISYIYMYIIANCVQLLPKPQCGIQKHDLVDLSLSSIFKS